MFISNDLDSRVHCSQVTRPQFLPLTQMLQFCIFFVPARNEGKDLWGDDESGGDHWRNVVAKKTNKQTVIYRWDCLCFSLSVLILTLILKDGTVVASFNQTLRPPPDIHSHSFEARWRKKTSSTGTPWHNNGTAMTQQWHTQWERDEAEFRLPTLPLPEVFFPLGNGRSFLRATAASEESRLAQFKNCSVQKL